MGRGSTSYLGDFVPYHPSIRSEKPLGQACLFKPNMINVLYVLEKNTHLLAVLSLVPTALVTKHVIYTQYVIYIYYGKAVCHIDID